MLLSFYKLKKNAAAILPLEAKIIYNLTYADDIALTNDCSNKLQNIVIKLVSSTKEISVEAIFQKS